MRHRASRLHAAVAALLLALGALCTTAGVASLTSSSSDPSAVAPARHDADVTPRSAVVPVKAVKSAPHAAGPHVGLIAALLATATGALLLLGWIGAGRARPGLPRLVTGPLGARAPPALV
jgi:hypothetical protein